MSEVFFLKRYDRKPDLDVQLRYRNGKVVNLTGATSVRFRMKRKNGERKVDAACTVVEAATGKVRYEWQEADTNEVGEFEGEFLVDFNGLEQTVPAQGSIAIRIEARAA